MNQALRQESPRQGIGQESPPAYLTPAQVAEYFAVATKRVVKWIRRGELAAVHASVSTDSQKAQYRILPEAVQQFEAARAVKVRPPRRRHRVAKYKRYV